jgi:hypothetical protein
MDKGKVGLQNSEMMKDRAKHADGNVGVFAVEHVVIKAGRQGQHYGRHAEHAFQCGPNRLTKSYPMLRHIVRASG